MPAEHPDKRVLTYYQDEARFGQHAGRSRGSGPRSARGRRRRRQTQYEYLYVFSAVCPETGAATGLVTPNVNTGTMNAFLTQFAAELPPDVHAAVVLDRAGWHTASALRVPANVTLILLPPKSPELNPAENLWHACRPVLCCSHLEAYRLMRPFLGPPNQVLQQGPKPPAVDPPADPDRPRGVRCLGAFPEK